MRRNTKGVEATRGGGGGGQGGIGDGACTTCKGDGKCRKSEYFVSKGCLLHVQ